MSAYDFDMDGQAELVYRDQDTFTHIVRHINGHDSGELRASFGDV